MEITTKTNTKNKEGRMKKILMVSHLCNVDVSVYSYLKDIDNEFKVVNEFMTKKHVNGKLYHGMYFPRPGKFELQLYSFYKDKFIPIAKYVIHATKATSVKKAQNGFMNPYFFPPRNPKYSNSSPLNYLLD